MLDVCLSAVLVQHIPSAGAIIKWKKARQAVKILPPKPEKLITQENISLPTKAESPDPIAAYKSLKAY